MKLRRVDSAIRIRNRLYIVLEEHGSEVVGGGLV